MKKNMTMIRFFAGSMLLLATATSFAQTATAPTLSDGDKWIYDVTEEKNVAGAISALKQKWDVEISRAGAKTMAVSAKPIDSNMPPKELLRNADWSVAQNINGKNTTTSHPYDFPIKPGKTWKVEYVTENPDPRVKVQKITKNYTVVGWVDIKVPAGTFHALKVEMEGEWSKEYNTVGPSATSTVANGAAGSVAIAATRKPSTPQPTSGRLYDAFWYVPEMKTHVKLIVEDYQAGGTLNRRVTEELATSQVN